MKKIIILSAICLLYSCTKSLKQIRHCNEYKSFIKVNWLQKSKGLYHFKDNPAYWHKEVYQKYVREECLIGLTKKKVIRIFGKPTKVYINQTQDLIIYSMDELSLKMPIYGGSALYFDFKDEKVVGVFTGPASSDIPD
jgi:hypothetical protein